MKKRLIMLFATGGGLGYAPVASGTFGSLPGLAIVGALGAVTLPWQIGISIVLALASFPLCQAADPYFDKKDDGRIVADEYLTFPLCVLGLPWQEHLWLLPMAFVICRILDIIKPFPAYRSQKLPGGIGIAMDDLISSTYALGINHLIWWLVNRQGWI
jgi:phosphatidylglycerophosphatase A